MCSTVGVIWDSRNGIMCCVTSSKMSFLMWAISCGQQLSYATQHLWLMWLELLAQLVLRYSPEYQILNHGLRNSVVLLDFHNEKTALSASGGDYSEKKSCFCTPLAFCPSWLDQDVTKCQYFVMWDGVWHCHLLGLCEMYFTWSMSCRILNHFMDLRPEWYGNLLFHHFLCVKW